MPEITKKDIWKQAKDEANDGIATARVALLMKFKELDDVNGDDDIDKSLRTILEQFEKGLPLARIYDAFSDRQALNAVREAMKKAGEIEEAKEGASKVIRLKRPQQNQLSQEP